MTTKLDDYMGQPVTVAGIEFAGSIAAGLGTSHDTAPVVVGFGERRYIVLEVVGGKHRHEPVDRDEPGGALKLVNVLAVDTTMFVEREVVVDVVTEHKRVEAENEAARKLAADKAKGIQTFDDIAGDDDGE